MHRSEPDDAAEPGHHDAGRGRRTRPEHRAATEAAIRRAGMRLFQERGFKGTTTDDIAREAGVSPRTFFNYFATKDAVVQLPRGALADTLRAALLARPAGEDPATSVAVAAVRALAGVGGAELAASNPIFRAGARMVARFPQMQHRAWERRAELEQVAWQTLQDRGVSSDDLAARTAVTVVMGLGWQAILTWAHDDSAGSLPMVMIRCLLALPHPTRFAAALLDEA